MTSELQRWSSSQERRDHILTKLQEQDRTSVGELSQLLNVSEVTVRKDLDQLEAQGLVTRVHGGAVFSGRGRFELHFAAREQVCLDEKRRIAQFAATLIEGGQTIFLDASTSAFQVARLLKDRKDLTVVTNGLYTALELTFSPGVVVVVVGGIMRRQSSSLVGGLSHDLLERLRVDLGFFGARGITPTDGMTEADIEESQLKRRMVAASATVVGILDSSKFGNVQFSSFALPHEIDRIITSTEAPAEQVAELRDRSVHVDCV